MNVKIKPRMLPENKKRVVRKKDEFDGIKTFEVYSSYITLASNVFKQTKTLICVMVYNVEK